MTKAHSNGGWKPPTVRIPSFDPDTDTLTAALEYANAGWYVIPVDKATKNPGSVVGKGWETKSSRDPQVVASWFAGSDYGIALHAGRSGVVVFDVDAPSQVPDTLAKWLDETVPYQSTRPDQPGRGHFVFTQPQVPVGNSLGSLPRGFGDVRGKNGVIVAYPTPHINGGRYLWERAGTVPPLPTEIEHALRTPTFHDTDTRPGEEYTALDADTQRRVDGWTH